MPIRRILTALFAVYAASIVLALSACFMPDDGPQMALLSCGLFIASILTAGLIGIAVGIEYATARALPNKDNF
jgi:hypothetical protein